MIRVSIRPSRSLSDGYTIRTREVFTRRDLLERDAWHPDLEIRPERRRRQPLTLAGWIGLAMILGAMIVIGVGIWQSL